MGHSSCILDDKLYVSGGSNDRSIEVAKCADLISNSATYSSLGIFEKIKMEKTSKWKNTW